MIDEAELRRRAIEVLDRHMALQAGPSGIETPE
jgi:hypothetical protein